jgi:thioredoxin
MKNNKIFYGLGIMIIAGVVIFVVNANNNSNSAETKSKETVKKEHVSSYVQHLNLESFKTKIFNFEQHKDWNYAGSQPAIIEFYADWCGPCKMIAPVLDELSVKYKDEVKIYKINVDHQKQLAGMFRVQSIPTFFFIPADDKPYMARGALSKEALTQQINEKLLN